MIGAQIPFVPFVAYAILTIMLIFVNSDRSTSNALFTFWVVWAVAITVGGVIAYLSADPGSPYVIKRMGVTALSLSLRLFSLWVFVILAFFVYDYVQQSSGSLPIPPIVIVGMATLSFMLFVLLTTLSAISIIKKREQTFEALNKLRYGGALCMAVILVCLAIVGRTLLRRFNMPLPNTPALYFLLAAPIAAGYLWGKGSAAVNDLINKPIDMLINRSNIKSDMKSVNMLHSIYDYMLDTNMSDDLNIKMNQYRPDSDSFTLNLFNSKVEWFNNEKKQDARYDVPSDLLKTGFQLLYLLTPHGIGMMLRCMFAHTTASSASDIATKLLERVKAAAKRRVGGSGNPQKVSTLTKIKDVLGPAGVVFLSVILGGLAAPLIVFLVSWCVLFVTRGPCWKKASTVTIALIVTSRVLRTIDLRGFSGVGNAEGILDHFCSAAYAVWSRFHQADDICLDTDDDWRNIVQQLEKESDGKDDKDTIQGKIQGKIQNKLNDRLETVSKNKLYALCGFTKEIDRIWDSIRTQLYTSAVFDRNYIQDDEVITMLGLVEEAGQAVRDNHVEQLKEITQKFTAVMLNPNVKLMRMHGLMYVVSLIFIAVASSIGTMCGRSLAGDNATPDVVMQRQRECTNAALIVSFGIIISINAYLAFR